MLADGDDDSQHGRGDQRESIEEVMLCALKYGTVIHRQAGYGLNASHEPQT